MNYLVSMFDDEPERRPDLLSTNPAIASRTMVTGSTVSEVRKIENALRSVGKDPDTTSFTEAREIVRLLESSSQYNDRKFYRQVLIVLGIFVIGSLIGMIVLALSEKAIPGSLIALGSASIGMFAGIVVAASGRSAGPNMFP